MVTPSPVVPPLQNTPYESCIHPPNRRRRRRRRRRGETGGRRTEVVVRG